MPSVNQRKIGAVVAELRNMINSGASSLGRLGAIGLESLSNPERRAVVDQLDAEGLLRRTPLEVQQRLADPERRRRLRIAQERGLGRSGRVRVGRGTQGRGGVRLNPGNIPSNTGNIPSGARNTPSGVRITRGSVIGSEGGLSSLPSQRGQSAQAVDSGVQPSSRGSGPGGFLRRNVPGLIIGALASGLLFGGDGDDTEPETIPPGVALALQQQLGQQGGVNTSRTLIDINRLLGIINTLRETQAMQATRQQLQPTLI